MDRQVVERVFKEHYSDIYNFIYHYIMDEDDAKDLAQDTFIAFMQAQDTLPPDLNVKQYLLSIAKNRCISFLRHKQVEDRHNLKYFESVVFTAATEYDTTRDELLDRRLVQTLPVLEEPGRLAQLRAVLAVAPGYKDRVVRELNCVRRRTRQRRGRSCVRARALNNAQK